MVSCTLNNITPNNDGDSIYAHSIFSEIANLVKSNNRHGSGTMYISQSVINLDNYAINNLVIDRCYVANYGGNFCIESKPGISITINNLITANRVALKGGEIVGCSCSGTETNAK